MDLQVMPFPSKLEDFCDTCGHQVVYCVGYKVSNTLPMFVASMRLGDNSLSIPCFCRPWMSRIIGKYVGLVGNRRIQCNVMVGHNDDGLVTHFADGWSTFTSLNGADEQDEAIFYLGKHRIFEVMMIRSKGIADTFKDIMLTPLPDVLTRGAMTRLAMRRNILSCYVSGNIMFQRGLDKIVANGIHEMEPVYKNPYLCLVTCDMHAEFEAPFCGFLPPQRRAIIHSVRDRAGIFAAISKTDEGNAVIDNGWSLMIDQLSICAGCVCLFQFDVKDKFIHVCVNNFGVL
ncbi:hypothetical protein ACP70R_036645 [Stipagrostis hirtigluma subsp. patula]